VIALVPVQALELPKSRLRLPPIQERRQARRRERCWLGLPMLPGLRWPGSIVLVMEQEPPWLPVQTH
jgi:hypothetical protein